MQELRKQGASARARATSPRSIYIRLLFFLRVRENAREKMERSTMKKRGAGTAEERKISGEPWRHGQIIKTGIPDRNLNRVSRAPRCLPEREINYRGKVTKIPGAERSDAWKELPC